MTTPAAAGQALQGRHILVTRPLQQADGLADAIIARGGVPLIFPLLEITPAADLAPLQRVAAVLADFNFAVFVSPNAVQHALPVLLAQQAWPSTVQPLAVGPGTVRALAAAGVPGCLCPKQRFDSEALLELPQLARERLEGRRVLILRGNGGRELLGDTLAARGAEVQRVTCYERRGPVSHGPLWQAFQAALDQGRLDALTLSSSEALAYLLELAPLSASVDSAGPARRQALLRLPLFVPHERIAAKAGALGFLKVVLTEPADAGLLAGLCAYNWPQP